MIDKAQWFIKELILRIKYMSAEDCIFCQIVRGEIKSKPILETEGILAINDINPVAPVHILIIPKNHIDSVLTVGEENGADLVGMFEAARILVGGLKLDSFRLAFNGGNYQHVPHLHMHLLAGGKVEWKKL